MPSKILHLYFACQSVCLIVCLLVSNKRQKTADPIGTKFCVEHHVTPGKVYEGFIFHLQAKNAEPAVQRLSSLTDSAISSQFYF